jgi:phosphoribosylanthranilate isomerase
MMYSDAPVRVKICGITRPEDAKAAVAAGADALGFNFWPHSKRYLRPEAARAIIATLPPFVVAVGVFVNEQRDEIERLASRSGIQALQLHGDETPADCTGYALPVIRGLRVGADFNAGTLAAFAVSAYLLDAPAPGYGGSGTCFDWNLLKGVQAPSPIILAGGLTPKNVADAVRCVHPYAVDVASGVESAPGIKDASAMRAFVAAAKSA